MSPWEVSFGSKVRSQSSEECFLGTRKFPSLSKEQDRERERQRERRDMTDWLTFSFWFGNELKIAHFCRFLARWLEAITRHKTINFPSNPRVHNLRRRKSRITTLPPISKSRESDKIVISFDFKEPNAIYNFEWELLLHLRSRAASSLVFIVFLWIRTQNFCDTMHAWCSTN